MTDPIASYLTTPQESDLLFSDLPSEGILSPAWIEVELNENGAITHSAQMDIPGELRSQGIVAPVGSSPYLISPDTDTGQCTWMTRDRTVASYPFDWNPGMKRFIVADVEMDGDYDVFMEYKDGSTAVSYNVLSDIRGMTRTDPSPLLTTWLEDRAPGYGDCFGTDADLQVDVLSAMIFRMSADTDYHEILKSVPSEYEMKLSQRLAQLDRDTETQKTTLQESIADSAPSFSDGSWFGYSGTVYQQGCVDVWNTGVKPLFDEQVSAMDDLSSQTHLLIKHKEQMGFGIGARLNFEVSLAPVEIPTVRVVGVLSGQPAEKAGLKSGDEIHSVDGVEIKELVTYEYVMANQDKFPNYFAADPELAEQYLEQQLVNTPLVFVVPVIAGGYGSYVKLGVYRDGESIEIEVERRMNLLPMHL